MTQKLELEGIRLFLFGRFVQHRKDTLGSGIGRLNVIPDIANLTDRFGSRP